MNINNLTEQQKQAFLDLAMLAMYADGHLAAAEDVRIHRLLSAIGYASEYDRNKLYDASVSRVSRYFQSPETACSNAAALAESFSTHEQRRRVLDILDDLVISDKHVSLKENSLLSVVREALQL